MVSLHKNYVENESIKSFEETYKSAYSHGLEAIYALENVDIRSVRPLQESSPKQFQEKYGHSQKIWTEDLPQMDLDLGPGFREWIEPFLLNEPIQVLDLSKYAEKTLIEHGKTYLKHLLGYDLQKLIFLKGMGQGHIDEIQNKLHNYTKGKELIKAKSVDFAGWLRSLVSGSSIRKKIFVCLEEHQMGALLTLTPMEMMEIRRLIPEKRRLWIKEAMEELRQKIDAIKKQISLIANAFIKPWLRLRHGIATVAEIQERLERVSDCSEWAFKVLRFFEKICGGNAFLMEALYKVSSDLYSLDSLTKENYEIVINRALSYFYKPGIHYRVQELVGLISRECAIHWIGFPDGFIEKVLRLSPDFLIYKNENNSLTIRKS